eukprot:scaffold3624_cov69-Skeletonema_dohrnii-CCMP3373.AAC.3
MEQRLRQNDAAVKDAQIELPKEACALGMGQSSNDAVMKDALIKPNEMECARSMGHIDPFDESTAFASSCRSADDKTTATLPN